MNQNVSKVFFYFSSLLACIVLAFTTACASGGYKLTRQYAGFVNKQQIIIRIIVYLLTGIVFAVTLLVDMVIFNTVDFWQGRVSEGTYEFNKEGRTFQVHHEVLPNSRKQSTIRILTPNRDLLQLVVLKETSNGEIEMSVNGKVRAQVRDITSLPVVSIYDTNGSVIENKMLFLDIPVVKVADSNRL